MREMHQNSLDAHTEDEPKLCKRMIEIFNDVKLHGKGTDREIAERMGFGHRSEVQPRISDLIKIKHLEEVGKVKCAITGKTVRVVDVHISKREPVQATFCDAGAGRW